MLPTTATGTPVATSTATARPESDATVASTGKPIFVRNAEKIPPPPPGGNAADAKKTVQQALPNATANVREKRTAAQLFEASLKDVKGVQNLLREVPARTATTTTAANTRRPDQDAGKANPRETFIKTMEAKAGVKLNAGQSPAMANNNAPNYAATASQPDGSESSQVEEQSSASDGPGTSGVANTTTLDATALSTTTTTATSGPRPQAPISHQPDGEKPRKSAPSANPHSAQGIPKRQNQLVGPQIAEAANNLRKAGHPEAAMAMVSLELHLNQNPPPAIITICHTVEGTDIPPAYLAKGLAKSTRQVAYFLDALPVNPTAKDIKRLYEMGQIPKAVYDNRDNIKILGLGGNAVDTAMLEIQRLQAKMDKADKRHDLRLPSLAAGVKFLQAQARNKQLSPTISAELGRTIKQMEDAMNPFSKTKFSDARTSFAFTAMKVVSGKMEAADTKLDSLNTAGAAALLDFCEQNPDSTAIYVGSVFNLFDNVRAQKERKGLNSTLSSSLEKMGHTGGVTSIIFDKGKDFEWKDMKVKTSFGEKPATNEDNDILTDENGDTIMEPIGETVIATRGSPCLHIPASIYPTDSQT